jgi:hypothetical protein
VATVIPLNNTAFATSGERRFYDFLREAVKPDSQCLAWYAPAVEGLEPDFILYTPEEGLIVFEVKDWSLSQIRFADSRTFTLALPGGREEARNNPMQQARDYVFAILDRIRFSCKRLLSAEQRHQGKPRLPVQGGVVFANITREEFTHTGLGKVLPVEKAFFADDLALALAGDAGSSGERLRGQLAAMFPPLFPFRLDAADLAALRELLWPQVRIVLPQRSGEKSAEDPEAEIRQLDAQQESLARRLDAPKAIVEGPAGSGKSLVLMHKAIQEHQRLRQKGCSLPVLVVCYNLTLVHYLKRLLAGRKARLGNKDILVTHFYAFCRSILREPLTYENEDADYYDLVTRMALDAAGDSPPFGAVFVDEGQDFSDAMLQVLRELVRADGLFWIALDGAQALYTRNQIWLTDKTFQHFSLRRPYRATRALTAFCEALLSRGEGNCSAEETQPECFAVRTKQGEKPRLSFVPNLEQGAAYIVERIRDLHGRGIPYAEMTILYASRKRGDAPGKDLPEFLLASLEENGILASWLSRDAQSKASWDITTDSVALSTIHSMKGMDAEAVFVLGLDGLETSHMPEESARALA